MTIGIGLICRDSIVLASDCKTEDDYGVKRNDLLKITLAKPGSRFKWGIVQSGKTDFACRCVERIAARAESEQVATAEGFRKIAEEEAKAVRVHAKEIVGDAMQAIVESRFALILGVLGPPAKLFTLDSASCLTQAITNGRASIGNSAMVAEYILDGIDLTQTPLQQAEMAALYAAIMSAAKDARSEGPICIAEVHSALSAYLSDGLIEAMTHDCLSFESEQQNKWTSDLLLWSLEKSKARFEEQSKNWQSPTNRPSGS